MFDVAVCIPFRPPERNVVEREGLVGRGVRVYKRLGYIKGYENS